MKFLFILLLLFFGCDDSPTGPSLDLCGVVGGNDINEDGYHCGDLQVLQDIIDANPSLEGQNPTEMGYFQEWNNDGRLFHLSLDDSQIISLPESIGDLSSLEVLLIRHTPLTNVPESIGDLSSLEWLELEDNQLISIPESIGELSSLEHLNLSNSQFTSLPESIGQLNSLEYLGIHHNQLTSIPESICNLPNVNVNVSNNYLCEEYHYECIISWNPQDQTNCP